jgi:hypothetical protein
MLKITIPPAEGWDEKTEKFVDSKGTVLDLEHSLVSLSKWESKWCKPFLTNLDKTPEEVLDYIVCMTITQHVSPEIYLGFTRPLIEVVNDYIGKPMTATVISSQTGRSSREVVTAELIYYWMIALNIPFECQKWHLNRLLTLINVCNIKNGPQKKMSQKDIMRRNTDLNAARRAALNSKG